MASSLNESSDTENHLIPSQPPSPPRKPHPRVAGLRNARYALRSLSPNSVPSPPASSQVKRRFGGVTQDDARDPFRDEAGFQEIVRLLPDGSTSLKRIDSRGRKSLFDQQVSPTKKKVSRPKLRLTMKVSEVSPDYECLEVTDHHCIKLDNISPGSEFSVDLGEVPVPSLESSDEEEVAEILTPCLSIGDQSFPESPSDDNVSLKQHSRVRKVSIVEEPRTEASVRRFGTVFSGSPEIDVPFADIPTEFNGTLDGLQTDILRSVEQGHAIEIVKLPKDIVRREYVIHEIFQEFEEHCSSDIVREFSHCNQHHAMNARHVIYAPNAYQSGAGLLGFLGSPVPVAGLWDKTPCLLPGSAYDPIGALLRRFDEQGTVLGRKSIEPVAEGCPSVLYRVFHDQLEKVDAALKELWGRPVVALNTSWVANVVNAEQSVDNVDRSVLEMLMNDSPSVSPTAMDNLLLK